MLFNSIEYIIFFPLVALIYFLLPKVKHRQILLLFGSWFFYAAWKPEYIILLLISTFVDYVVAIKIYKTENISKQKFLLIISLIINLGILFSFKYFNFFGNNIHRLLLHYNLLYSCFTSDLILPVGISFYTFQTISYTIDVYKKNIKPEKQFIKFALFVSFFPQLVAGPIERAGHLLPQFNIKHKFNYERVTSGLKLMFWGFFQKVVIADSLSRFVDAVYSKPGSYHTLDLILVTFFFGIQILSDFSGYTDIARGSAKILGYDIRINFNLPYFAQSFADFWRRWHISLSSWFRDYVFIPLGGSRSSKRYRVYFNIMFTFVLSGFWHGAGWNFLIWGVLHGSYYIIEKNILRQFPNIKNIDNKFVKIFKIFFVFILVNFAWIFFRSPSITIAFTVIDRILDFSFIGITFDKQSIFLNLLLSAFLFGVHFIERKKDIVTYVSQQPFLIRWGIYYVMSFALITLGNFGLTEFIYFQF